MRLHLHLPSRRAAASALLAIAVLGGCGSEDPSGSSSGTTTALDASTTTSDPTATRTLAEITSIKAVSNGPTAPSVVELPDANVTSLINYHWNDAQGVEPGTISLRAADGTLYGPFETVGLPGQGGVPNAYWEAKVDLDLPAGTYTVEDSDPATWSWAPDTAGRGMVQILGR